MNNLISEDVDGFSNFSLEAADQLDHDLLKLLQPRLNLLNQFSFQVKATFTPRI